MNQFDIKTPWTRSPNGWIAGVCQGIGERLDVSPGGVRLLWLLSVLFFGVGFLFYIICAICLPMKGKEQEAQKPKILGVCYRLSQRFDMDVGLIRILTVVIALGSMGTTLLAYILIHFLVPQQSTT